jgi:wyosine [tRNA(Phe)-imidazoG37] synthetase (radical SAM superfamily)
MYVYGPVPSRRLGRSLGVSPIPAKTCSYNCVYCQLGRTNYFQARREEFYPQEDILKEIIDKAGVNAVDYITIVGDGEPTLYSQLGRLIHGIKENLEYPVAVITNGSLLYREEVRRDLERADVVIPSLDSGIRKTMRSINRPHGSLEFSTILKGQISFREEFKGQLWLEIMLVKGVNDSKEELEALRLAVDEIKPDRVYIMSPVRPPAESWVEPAEPQSIIMAQEIIGRAVTVTDIETGEIDFSGFTGARQAIIEIGSRHPLRREQAQAIENKFSETGVVERLLEEKELVEVAYGGQRYLLPRHFIRR